MVENTIDFREKMKVEPGPVIVRLQPYTERRRKEIDKIQKEITEFIEQFGKQRTFTEMPRKDKAYFWQKKASILWEPIWNEDIHQDYWDESSNTLTKKFFMDDDFEYPKLEKTESFFFSQQMYL